MRNICWVPVLSAFFCGCATPALHKPAETGNIAAARALLAKGEDPNENSGAWNSHMSALHIAVLNSRVEVARLLIKHGADLNAEAYNKMQGSHYGTPLHLAACIGNEEMVQLLLASGADPNPGTGGCWGTTAFVADGKTPLALAESNGHQTAASLIRSAVSTKLGLTAGSAKNTDEYGPIITSLLKSYRGEGKTIAVAGFSYTDGRVSSDGNIVSERFTTELINRKVMRVVERDKIEKVLGELKLQNIGAIDPESAKKVGHMLGADLLVIGGMVELTGKVLELNIRLASVESGESVAAVTGQVQKDWVQQ